MPPIAIGVDSLTQVRSSGFSSGISLPGRSTRQATFIDFTDFSVTLSPAS